MEINPSTNTSPKPVAPLKAKRLAPKRMAPIDLACRLVIAPALLIAPFVAIDHAAAACDPPSPVNNTTVTCTGTTGSPNTPVGYGIGTDTGNTINVLSGASVTGSDRGLLFQGGTVNNFGTITQANDDGSIAFLLDAQEERLSANHAFVVEPASSPWPQPNQVVFQPFDDSPPQNEKKVFEPFADVKNLGPPSWS